MRPSATTTDTTSVNGEFPKANRHGESSRPGEESTTIDPASIRPLVVGVETAIELLDSNRDDIYELLRQKKLLSYLDGRRRKIFMSSIDELIRQRHEAAVKQPFERHRYPGKPRSSKRAGAAR